MTDHELIIQIIIIGSMFFVFDFCWKVFGTQRRLNDIERALRKRDMLDS